MNKNRDILVLLKENLLSQHTIEQKVSALHGLLQSVERLDSFARPHEIIDLNKHRIYKSITHIRQYVTGRPPGFVFLNCCN